MDQHRQAKATRDTASELIDRLSAMGGYCPTLDELFVGLNYSRAQRQQLCQHLGQAGQLKFREEITRFGLTVAAKTLLKLDTSVWPVTPDELLVLRSCTRGRIAPGQIHGRVPVHQRQPLLRHLAQKGLIMVYQTDLVEIALVTVEHPEPPLRNAPLKNVPASPASPSGIPALNLQPCSANAE